MNNELTQEQTALLYFPFGAKLRMAISLTRQRLLAHSLFFFCTIVFIAVYFYILNKFIEQNWLKLSIDGIVLLLLTFLLAGFYRNILLLLSGEETRFRVMLLFEAFRNWQKLLFPAVLLIPLFISIKAGFYFFRDHNVGNLFFMCLDILVFGLISTIYLFFIPSNPNAPFKIKIFFPLKLFSRGLEYWCSAIGGSLIAYFPMGIIILAISLASLILGDQDTGSLHAQLSGEYPINAKDLALGLGLSVLSLICWTAAYSFSMFLHAMAYRQSLLKNELIEQGIFLPKVDLKIFTPEAGLYQPEQRQLLLNLPLSAKLKTASLFTKKRFFPYVGIIFLGFLLFSIPVSILLFKLIRNLYWGIPIFIIFLGATFLLTGFYASVLRCLEQAEKSFAPNTILKPFTQLKTLLPVVFLVLLAWLIIRAICIIIGFLPGLGMLINIPIMVILNIITSSYLFFWASNPQTKFAQKAILPLKITFAGFSYWLGAFGGAIIAYLPAIFFFAISTFDFTMRVDESIDPSKLKDHLAVIPLVLMLFGFISGIVAYVFSMFLFAIAYKQSCSYLLLKKVSFEKNISV